MQDSVVKTISSLSPYFPQEFKDILKPVHHFYAAGNLALLQLHPRVGIVGSRSISRYGQEVTRDMSRAIANGGGVVVSGLAFGVDSVAHEVALMSSSPTIAVLPGGLGKIYPASHHALAERIITNNGLLISEYHGCTPPKRHHFIERNRLVAALSDVLLVTEASARSGTRHTVDAAILQGRKVAVVPGNITSPRSEGTNLFIRDGGPDIHPITSTSDLLMLAGINEKNIKSHRQGTDAHESAIIAVLQQRQVSPNELCRLTKLPIHIINATLTALELRSVVESIHGQWRLI